MNFELSPKPDTSGPASTDNKVNPALRHLAHEGFKFHDATHDWNLDFQRYDDIRGLCRIQESTGGGAAVFDYDLDNNLDLFMIQGTRLPRALAADEFTNEMFRNTGRFQKATANTGLTSHGYHTGCTVGDVNEDGFQDLYVTAYGRSSLWQNAGDGTFRNTSESSKVVIDGWSSSAAFADFNADGLLDLFVTTYLAANDNPPKLCKSSESPTGFVQCSPSLFDGLDDVLFLNDGQGGFIDATREAGVSGRNGKGLGVLAYDFDGDGILEIFVANDTTPCFLYRQRKGFGSPHECGILVPRYEEAGVELGVALNGDGQATAAMGVAHADYDRDGWIDFFVTNFYLETNTLFRNLQGTEFLDMSKASRLGPPSRLTLAFGTSFLDIDHDGWSDLIIATGHVEDKSWTGHEPYKMRPHLFRNERNGKFSDVASSSGKYFQRQWIGRGLAIGDIDRDGDLDVIVCHQVDPSVVLLNETPSNQTSVIVRPIGRNNSSRSAVGVRLTAKGIDPPLSTVIAGGGSFQSASASELHLGLGDRDAFDELELTWPDGKIDRWKDVAPGYYVAIEGRGFYRISTEDLLR